MSIQSQIARLLVAALLLILSISAYSNFRLVTICYLHPHSANTQAQAQGIKLVQLRATIDNKVSDLRPHSRPQCTPTFKTNRRTAKIVPECYWELSTNYGQNRGERGRCSVSGIRPIKLFDAREERQLSAARKKHLCIIASVQKGSRGCNHSNTSFCVRISTQQNSIAQKPIQFQIQKIHGKTESECRGLADNNTS